MLGQRHRFHGYGSLKPVYARGTNVRGTLLSLKYLKRHPIKNYRVAVVVSRKVHKSAVIRNRIRRRIYEVVRTTKQPIASGTDLIFTVYSDKVADLSSAELSDMINQLLQKTTKTAAQTPVSRDIVKHTGN